MEEQEKVTEKPEKQKSQDLELVQSPVSSKFSVRTIAIVFAVIILVFASIFFVVSKQKISPQTKIATNIITPFPTKDQTIEWKIFTDPNFNYSFRYSPNWKISYLPQSGNNRLPKGEPPESFVYSSGFMITNTISSKDSPLQVLLFLYKNDKNLTLEQWVNTHHITYSGSQEKHKDETITVNEQNAIKETIIPDLKTWGSTEQPVDESIYLNHLTNGENIIYIFELIGNGEGGSKLYTVNDPFVQEVMPAFETFVNSLKFTN